MPAKVTKHLMMRSRNDAEKALRRELMLDAAQRVFFKKGFEHTVMDDIAHEAGLSRGLLYVYFKDKKGIYDALRVRATEALLNRMRDYVDAQTLGINKIQASGRAFYHFYRDDRRFYDCLSHSMSLNNQGTSKRFYDQTPEGEAIEKATMEVMVGAIQQGWEDGSLSKGNSDDPLEIALFLRGALHGIIMLQSELGSALLTQPAMNREEFIERAVVRLASVFATTQPHID